jgi:hypothetical protein
VAKPARQFGHAMQILNHYHYSFLQKLIVFTVYGHGNICIAWPNCRAGFATGYRHSVIVINLWTISYISSHVCSVCLYDDSKQKLCFAMANHGLAAVMLTSKAPTRSESLVTVYSRALGLFRDLKRPDLLYPRDWMSTLKDCLWRPGTKYYLKNEQECFIRFKATSAQREWL